MAAKVGSFRHNFVERSKERLLSIKGYSDFGLNSSYGGEEAVQFQCIRSLSNAIVNLHNGSEATAAALYRMGREDPRKVCFAIKMGLSLAFVSLVVFLKEPLKNVGQYSIWAILTVVVVFEFSVGATLNKGFDRALGTFSAGGLALGIAELSLRALISSFFFFFFWSNSTALDSFLIIFKTHFLSYTSGSFGVQDFVQAMQNYTPQ